MWIDIVWFTGGFIGGQVIGLGLYYWLLLRDTRRTEKLRYY